MRILPFQPVRQALADPSRRGMLLGLASLGLLPGLAQGQEASSQASGQTPDQAAGQTPPGESADIAARTDAFSHLTIEVSINGTGPYRFVIDTGAERSVVSDVIATKMGLVRGEHVMVDGLARQIPAQTVTLAELTFGPFRRKNLVIPVLPRSLLGCDGYLGLDAIKNTRVTFDFAHNVLGVDSAMRDPARYDRRHESTRVQMSGTEGRMRATDCWVDGVRTTVFIDTGAEVSVGNLVLLSVLKKRKVPPPELGRILLVGVTGGEAVGEIIPIRGIRLQALNFSNGTLAIADIPNFATWGLDKKPALLIGMDFLRQFGKVSIDYRSQEVRFDLAGGIPAKPPVPAIAGGAPQSGMG